MEWLSLITLRIYKESLTSFKTIPLPSRYCSHESFMCYFWILGRKLCVFSSGRFVWADEMSWQKIYLLTYQEVLFSVTNSECCNFQTEVAFTWLQYSLWSGVHFLWFRILKTAILAIKFDADKRNHFAKILFMPPIFLDSQCYFYGELHS